MAEKLSIVYHSLNQVVRTLRTSRIGNTREVRQLLEVSSTGANGVLDPESYLPRIKHVSAHRKPKMPFIVIEGLDGSGKTKVSTSLNEQLGMELQGTPPERIKFLKPFFDDQCEPLRRAYYSMGNYLAAQDIENSSFKMGIVMDRYWHSTAAYAFAHELSHRGKPGFTEHEISEQHYNWPSDLLKPDIVVFLVVSEEVRRYRHAYRSTTNTKEEQAIANNDVFRAKLLESYRRIKGPLFQELEANEDIEIVKKKVLDFLVNTFPILKNSDDGHSNSHVGKSTA